jgi:hypothetical protein
MSTLSEILKNLIEEGDHAFIALDDGSSNWHAETLLKEGLTEEELNEEMSEHKTGIYPLDEQGYVQSIPRYKYHYGKWSETEDRFIHEDEEEEE